ncbi:MAG: fused MFS/spermidine synthase [Candidatus Krumholzibacteriia bacterium]
MVSAFLYLAVIVSGASVLILEILGTRVLGPYYGVSIYLWSALIGVTLAALSLGYALGGHLADRKADLGRFSIFYLLAGLFVLALPFAVRPVLDLLEPLGLKTAALSGAAILFFPPLLVLGMATPFALRLKAESLDRVGRTAGNLYAVSTLASVVAAIGTGFFLVPGLGVRRILVLTGAVLLMTALLGLMLHRKSRRVLGAALALAIGLPLIQGWVPRETAEPSRGLLALRQSAYGEIRVLDRQGLRYMLIDGATHSIADPLTWRSTYPYADVLEIGKLLRPEPGRMLLVGLGAGSVAKSYALAGWRVDAVEIDPVVVDLAREFFHLQDAEATVHQADGRRFLRETAEFTYDLIVLDAFGSSSVPFHLVTREVFGLIRSRLVPGGLLAMNLETLGWRDPLAEAVATTLAERFNDVLILPIAEPPDRLGNLILLASDQDLALAEDPAPPDSRWTGQYHLVHAWDNRFAPAGTGPILTDDRNPAGLWSNRINDVARGQLHSFFGRHSLAW